MAGQDGRFLLPPPNFNKVVKEAAKTLPHYLTPCGMTLLPRAKQPPPMYGSRGATLPAKFLQQHQQVQFRDECGSTTKPVRLISEPTVMEHCEACNMKFNTINDLKRHKQQHESCPVAACDYMGHPSVMDRHIEASHVSELYHEVKKMSTPEDISAWIAERRKRYPTVANVGQRERAKEQRQRRGERLEAAKSRFGNAEDRKRVRHQGISRGKRRFNGDETNKQAKKQHKPLGTDRVPAESKQLSAKKEVSKVAKIRVIENNEKEMCSGGIPMFKGTANMCDYKHFKTGSAQTFNALSSLLGMYGSDDDDEATEEENDDETVETHKKEMESTLVPKLIDLKSCNQNIESCLMPLKLEEQNLEGNKYCQKPVNVVTFEQSSNAATNENLNDPENAFSDEAPEEAPILHVIEHPLMEQNESIAATVNRKATVKPFLPPKKRMFGLNYRKRLRKQNTMLEKLLEGDIRHERNVLLQCVRFVCEQKYFGIGQSPSTNKM